MRSSSIDLTPLYIICALRRIGPFFLALSVLHFMMLMTIKDFYVQTLTFPCSLLLNAPNRLCLTVVRFIYSCFVSREPESQRRCEFSLKNFLPIGENELVKRSEWRVNVRYLLFWCYFGTDFYEHFAHIYALEARGHFHIIPYGTCRFSGYHFSA